MNCESFYAITNDLTKGALMDAQLRDEALSHAESCAPCEMRLTDERELTAGLRQLATVWNGEAPAGVEASVLAAFREQRAALPRLATASRRSSRWIYIAAGVAALVVIALVLSLTIWRTRDSVEPQKAERATSAPPVTNSQNDGQVKPLAPPAVKQRIASAAPDVRAADGNHAKGKQRRHQPQEDLRPDTEIATEFFPLNRGGIGPIDSAQMVRVELPRSAMMSFGLPINMDRADERIKADVVVGNDGMARAIRFVR